MTYKIKPIYASARATKPDKFAVVDSDGIQVDVFLYKPDAEKKVKELNAKNKKRHFI